MAFGMDLPASRMRRTLSRSMDCSMRSPPRSRTAASSPALVFAHRGAAAAAKAIAASTSLSVAAVAWPAATVGMIGGISNCLLGLPLGDGRGKDGLGLIGHASAIQDRALKLAACAGIRQIEPYRVLPLRAEQIARQDDLRMRRARQDRLASATGSAISSSMGILSSTS